MRSLSQRTPLQPDSQPRPKHLIDDQELVQLVNSLDDLILAHPHVANHNLAGVLLSRVVLLMQADPKTGKDLVKYVWERLDEIESADPNSYL